MSRPSSASSLPYSLPEIVKSPVPGPGWLSSLATSKLYGPKRIEALAQLLQRYGTVVRVPTSTRPLYLVAGAQGVRDVFLHSSHDTIKVPKQRPLFGRGLLTSEREVWLSQRRALQPSFTADRFPAIDPELDRLLDEVLDGWEARQGQPLNLERAMGELSVIYLGRLLFAQDLRDSAATIDHAVAVLTRGLPSLGQSLLTFGRSSRTYHSALRQIRTIAEAIYRNRNQVELPDSLLGRISVAHRHEPEVAIDQVCTFLAAGYDTVASSLAWTCYALAQHPEHQSAAREDLEALDQVWSETLRLYPPAWLITRTTTGPISVDGYTLPTGAELWILPYFVHRSPEVWETPSEFRPARFEAYDRIPRGGYIPFGLGVRTCIGRSLAHAQMQAILGRILERFTLRPDSQCVPSAEPLFTLQARGVRVYLDPRTRT